MDNRVFTALSAENAHFIDQLYTQYLENPAQLPLAWQQFFSGMQQQSAPEKADEKRSDLGSFLLQQAFREKGHLAATLDPLGVEHRPVVPELDPERYGVQDPFFVQHLRDVYAGTLGVEFMHLPEAQRQWMQEALESCRYKKEITNQIHQENFRDIIAAEGLEKFLSIKYPAMKRFGLEGGESLIPALLRVFHRAANQGVRQIVMGMAHRGRLNVLAHVLGQSYAWILSQFAGHPPYAAGTPGAGDVKYHLGASCDRFFGDTKLHLSLLANPSHLESVNPVVLGKVRAKQQQQTPQSVLGVLIHGDAAFSGQGMVMETLGLSGLEGYQTGGTLHLVTNNQVGFTTPPGQSRSSVYCSDIAKFIQAPVWHVNGDDVAAVVQAAWMAFDFLRCFGQDVVIDLVCYRRHGHNETDEPAFTQPVMYRAIADHASTATLYENLLVKDGILSAADVKGIRQAHQAHLQQSFAEAATTTPPPVDWLEGAWKGLSSVDSNQLFQQPQTGVSQEKLMQIGQQLASIPENFSLHPKLQRFLSGRMAMAQGQQPVDWSMAEALAFGTLLSEGTFVRLSGQDCGRGTFTQRHGVLIDQVTQQPFIPLNHLKSTRATIEMVNSSLSEAAVLGFEFGYSLADPNQLVLWEAQFGDFANGAQVVIDQYIAAAESKWRRLSGLVLLLPHGYEGQGPEHSSARLERYLQLCAENNMHVLNCTTPANYFHALRRQIHRPWRNPLVLMTPKSLLRHPQAVSALTQLAEGTCFQSVIGDGGIDPAAEKNVERVVLCSGKVYYDLLAKRGLELEKRVALVRIEQLYPFPESAVADALKKYPQARVVWCQEEPENNGAWMFLDRKLEKILKSQGRESAVYVGREAAASPATGSTVEHLQQQEALVNQALGFEEVMKG